MAEEVKPIKPKRFHSYGVKDVLGWEFKSPTIPQEWLDHLGDIPTKWHIYIDGDGGAGKTEYIMKLSQMLSQHFGKVHINNVEQGKHKQIMQAAHRNNFKDTVKPGTWMYNRITDFEAYKDKLRRRQSGKVQIIDSISYWPLNEKQIQELLNERKFRNKCFIFVGYKTHFNKNKPIAHLCDIKIRIEKFLAKPIGRFGGNQVFDILEGANQEDIDRLRFGIIKKREASPLPPPIVPSLQEIADQISMDDFKDSETVTLNSNGHA